MDITSQNIRHILDKDQGLISHIPQLGTGPGGQKVNNTKSSVRTVYNFRESPHLTESQKALIDVFVQHRHTHRTHDGKLMYLAHGIRSQHKAKQSNLTKMTGLLMDILRLPPDREGANPDKSNRLSTIEQRANQQRLIQKKYHSLKKKNRKHNR